MTIFPIQFNEVMQVYNRISKLKPATLLEKGEEEPRDIVNISEDAKKRQMLEQVRGEVLDHIRDVK